MSTTTTIGLFNGFISNASSTVNASLFANGNLRLPVSGFVGFAGSTAVDSTNYSLFGNTTLTLLNARSGGSIGFRIANADVANFSTTGGFGFGNTFYNLDPGQNNLIVEGNVGVGIAVPTERLHVSGNLLVTGNSTTTSATTTNLFTTTASTTNFYGAGLPGAGCSGTTNKVTWSGGRFACEPDETAGAGVGDIISVGDVTTGAAFDGTQGTTLTFFNIGGNATFDYDGTDFSSSKLITALGFQATASSTLQNFTGVNATTSQATTTSLAVSGVTSAIALTNANGSFLEYAGTTCTNQFVRVLSALGVATCATVANTDLANSTISGISLGSNLNSLSNGSTLLGTSYNGSATVSDWDIDLSNQNVWTSASTTFVGGVTIGTATTTQATTTSFAISGITSAIPLTNANGSFAEYAGTSCTNQFVRSLSALGVATCATVVAGDVDLADLTATNSTLTFSGTYDGSVARTIGLNLSNANTWTGGQIFANATATAATTTNFAVSSNGMTIGGVSNFVTATSTGGFRVASTSLDARGISFSTGTTSIQIATFPEARTLTSLYCVASSTGSVRYRIGDGTNWANSNSTSCSTTGARTYFTSTNTFTVDETVVVEIGTSATNPSSVTLSPTWIKNSQ